eukprot:294090-Prymnesium_polylepis.1
MARSERLGLRACTFCFEGFGKTYGGAAAHQVGRKTGTEATRAHSRHRCTRRSGVPRRRHTCRNRRAARFGVPEGCAAPRSARRAGTTHMSPPRRVRCAPYPASRPAGTLEAAGAACRA